MKWHRIWAMTLRHWINLKHSYDRMTDMFYWPAMDLLIWGITGLYLAKLNPNSGQYLQLILIGLVFWVIMWRSQYEVSTNVLSELWDRNLVNIFSAPLSVAEWAASFMVFGFFKTIVSVAFSATLAFLFYKFNIFVFGWYLPLYAVSLLLTGWASGFFVAGILIRFGNKVQTLAWAGIALIAPFSAIYYPASILPAWAQAIGWWIPSTYVFESLRSQLFHNKPDPHGILISFILNAVYLTLALICFKWLFEKSRKLGLGRLV